MPPLVFVESFNQRIDSISCLKLINTRGAFRENKKVAHFHEMDTI
jgi:hypothetical protein